MTDFKKFLKPEIALAIGYSKPTAVQRGALQHILEGSDVLNQAMSGSGRTLSSIICALEMLDLSLSEVSVIVLCSDVKKIYEKYKQASRYIDNIRIMALGLDSMSVEKQQFRVSPPNIVIGYPLRILTYAQEGKFSLDNVEQIIIHSADKLFPDRHRKKDIFNLFGLANSDAQVIVDTKTINNDMREDIKSIVNPERLKIITDADHKEEAKRGGANFMPTKKTRAMKTATTVQRDVSLRVELQRSLEFKVPTDIQYDVIPAINDKHDVICWGKPRSGKTTGIVLGMLNNLSPIRFQTHVLALTSESSKNYGTYSKYATNVEFAKVAHFGLKAFKHDDNIYKAGSWPVVLSTVERCAALCIGKTMVLKDIRQLIIHECDVLLDKTRSPKTPSLVGRIVEHIRDMSKVQVIMECGKDTLKPEVLAECKKYLKMKNLFSNVKGLKGTVNPPKSLGSEAKPGTSSQSSTEKLKSTTEQGKQKSSDKAGSKLVTEASKAKASDHQSKSSSAALVSKNEPAKTEVPAKAADKSAHKSDKTDAKSATTKPESKTSTDADQNKPTVPDNTSKTPHKEEVIEESAPKKDVPSSATQDTKPVKKIESKNVSDSVPKPNEPEPPEPTFSTLLKKDLNRAVPFSKPRKVQKYIIPEILQKKSIVHQSEIGSGKTTAVILGSLEICDTKPRLSIIALCSDGVNNLASMYRRYSRFLGYRVLSVHPMSFEEYSKTKVEEYKIIVGHPTHVAELMKAQIRKPLDVITINMHRCFTLVTDGKSDLAQAVGYIAKNIPTRQVLIEAPTISVSLLRIYKKHFPSHKLNVSSLDPSIMDYAKRMDGTDDAASSGEGSGAQKRAAPDQDGENPDDKTVSPKRPRQDEENISAQEKDGKENQVKEEEAEEMEQNEEGDGGNEEENAGSFVEESEEPLAQMETEEKMEEETGDLWDLGVEWRDYLAEAIAEFKRPSQVQRELVPLIVEGYDVLCQAPRGQFTTTGIVLGMVQQLTRSSPEATVLFLSTGIDELREVSETFSGFANFASNVAVSVVGMNSFEFERRELQGNGVNPVVLGTPGIILKLAKAGILCLKETRHFIIHHCDMFLESPELCKQLHSLFEMTHSERQVVLEASTCLSHIRPLCRSFMSGGILTSQWLVLDKGRKARITVSEPLEDVMACFQDEGQER